MSRDLALAAPSPAKTLPGWLPAALLLVATGLAGPSLGAAARPLFILGCGVVGWAAWRHGPAAHLQAALALFAFAPLLRRLVDLAAGYDTHGLMLVGPLLAVSAAGVALVDPAGGHESPRPAGTAAPLLLAGACVAYAGALSLAGGFYTDAASGLLKWSAPLVYAGALARSRTPSAALLAAACSAFAVILPLIGLYGVAQYVDPQAWDREWMNHASILSAGEPVPFGVRTFATMNGPASFATFTATGLLALCILGRGWLPAVCAAAAVPALLLSSYRTAWISLAVGAAFCLLFRSTRGRALGALAGGGLAVAAVAAFTPFGDAILDRVASFGGGLGDGSAQERLAEVATLWGRPDSGLFGAGFTTTDVGSAGAVAIDGTFVECWVAMGIVVGILCLTALGWAIAGAVAAAARDGRREAVLVGALACGALSQIPLASVTSGELGFLFWTFVVLLPPGIGRPTRVR